MHFRDQKLRIFLELKAPQKSHHVTLLDLCSVKWQTWLLWHVHVLMQGALHFCRSPNKTHLVYPGFKWYSMHYLSKKSLDKWFLVWNCSCGKPGTSIHETKGARSIKTTPSSKSYPHRMFYMFRFSSTIHVEPKNHAPFKSNGSTHTCPEAHGNV